MEKTFTKLIDPMCSSCSESELNFSLCDMSHGRFSSFKGNLTGPHCKYARTLPTTFAIPECKCMTRISHLTQKRITDPCYWTPQLPYLYDFEIDLTHDDQTPETSSHTVGFRRWEVEGQSFLLERRRTVLRGVVAESEQGVDLAEAHEAEVAVMVTNPSESFLQEASEIGVMVIADIRGSGVNLTTRLLSLAWQPSVALVIPDPTACYVPHSLILSETAEGKLLLDPEVETNDFSKVLCVELNTDSLLPGWMATVAKPVIAIRRGVEYSDLSSARSACDRLQTELAPEFDLAGYFVTP